MKKEYAGVDVNGNKLFFETSLNVLTFAKRRNVKLALVYQNNGNNHIRGIDIGTKLWDGKDHGIFEPYVADARINRTPKACFSKIKDEAIFIK